MEWKTFCNLQSLIEISPFHLYFCNPYWIWAFFMCIICLYFILFCIYSFNGLQLQRIRLIIILASWFILIIIHAKFTLCVFLLIFNEAKITSSITSNRAFLLVNGLSGNHLPVTKFGFSVIFVDRKILRK